MRRALSLARAPPAARGPQGAMPHVRNSALARVGCCLFLRERELGSSAPEDRGIAQNASGRSTRIDGGTAEQVFGTACEKGSEPALKAPSPRKPRQMRHPPEREKASGQTEGADPEKFRDQPLAA